MFKKPWEDLESPIIYSANYSKRKVYTNYIAWILGILFLIIGIFTIYRMAILIGIVLILTMITKKFVCVTNRGLEIFYDMFITKSYEKISHEAIDSVIVEEFKDDKELAILYFTIGDRTKRFYFYRKDIDDILNLIRKYSKTTLFFDAKTNKKIYVK